MEPRTAARVALAYLAVISVQIGVWAVLAPRSFYDGFPGLGRVWVGVDGPYNEHLVRDVGALNLAFVVLVVVTFVRPTRMLLLTTAGATAAWGIPHALYHLFNTDVLSGADLIISLGGLILFALVPLVLVVAARTADPAEARHEVAAASQPRS